MFLSLLTSSHLDLAGNENRDNVQASAADSDSSEPNGRGVEASNEPTASGTFL